MATFTTAELRYLTGDERHLGRLATVDARGAPHVTPVGWRLTDDRTAVEVGGHDLPATKKYRDVHRTGRAAIVIDDVLPPWRPRAVEVRGRAEADPGPPAVIRITPERIVSWGLEDEEDDR